MAREMKDSGIEWIGEIPASWRIGRIGYLYTERKVKVSDADYSPLSVTMKGILPQLSTAAKTDAHDDRKLVCKGDFAINSRSDRRGSCGISSYDGSVSLINTVLVPRGKMHPVYYNWLFHSTMFSDEFYKWGHGIVDDLWTTNWQDMKKISVPVPEFTEQERIANYLEKECSDIDAAIEQTRVSIEEYKKLKQAVITQAVVKGIRPDRQMKDSGIEWIGEIPVDWNRVKLKYYSTIRSGITLGKVYPAGTELFEYPYLRVANVQGSHTDLSDVAVIKVTAEEAIKYRLQSGELLMTEGGDRDKLGRGSVWHAEIDPCLHQNHVFALRTNENRLLAEYLSYITDSYVGRDYFDVTANQSVHLASTNSTTIMNFMIPFPSIEEQKEIVAYLDKKVRGIDVCIEQKNKLISELDSYKKSLIYEYVTGKKEVPA